MIGPCPQCGDPVIYAGTGRHPVYCSRKCKRRAQARAAGCQPPGQANRQLSLRGIPRSPCYWRKPALVAAPVQPAALNRQLPLFGRIVRDLSRYDPALHEDPGNPVLIAARRHAAELGAERGWPPFLCYDVDRSLPMLLSSHIDGDLVPAAEVAQLTCFNLPAGWVGEVLAQLGLLDDPRGPAIGRWITRQTAQVPAGFAADVRDWLRWLHTGDARTRPRADGTIYSYFAHVRPYLDEWGRAHGHLREITTTGITTALDKLDGRRHHNILTAIRSLFRYCRKTRRIFTDPAARLRSQRTRDANVLPLDQAVVDTATTIAVTPALRLIFALAAIHAARPHAIRHLAIDDIDLPNGRITLNSHTRPLGDLTAGALASYLAERRQRYPHTANPHLLLSRRTAGGTSPVTAPYLRQYLLRHGIRLEDIRVDRVLSEALTVGPGPLHLSLIFGLSPTTAIRYAEAARRILEEKHPHQGH